MVFTFVSGPVVQREIDKGTRFDVAISQPEVIETLIKSGKVAAGSRADIARTGVGVSVRAGAPKPDIGSVEAFRQTLLKAKSIAHSKEGASGVYFMGLLDRLGIAAEVKPKLIGAPAGAGGLVSPVVKGEAEMVVGTASAIMEAGRRTGRADPERVAALDDVHRRRRRGVERRSRRAGAGPLPHRARRRRGDQGQGHGAARKVADWHRR